MLDSTPVPLQAMLWPLAGAAIILILGRILPQWLGRLVAVAGSIASFAALWSLRGQEAAWIQASWEPLTFFRMGPSLWLTPLGLLTGLTLTATTAAVVLGIRSTQGHKATWHGWILVALTGCLLTSMAANGLTLALGSGLIDLALLATALSAPAGEGEGERAILWMCVPGIASTLLLFLAALLMDAQVGTASLLAREIPQQAWTLIGIGGLLRLMVFPLHPRGLSTPQQAVTYLLPASTGIYLLARVQPMIPRAAETAGVLVGAIALLAGGWMAWRGSTRSAPQRLAASWTGIAVHQVGLALAFVTLFGGMALWPLVNMSLALASLAIWWDSRSERPPAPWPKQLAPIVGSVEAQRSKARTLLDSLSGPLNRWRSSWPGRYVTALLPIVALGSLAGIPLTLGALARWRLYGIAMYEAKSSLLIAAWVADTLLVAALFALLRTSMRQAAERRPPVAALLSMMFLAGSTITLSVTPGAFAASLGLQPAEAHGVSAWGLGMLFVLSWLVGAWLSRVSRSVAATLERVLRVANPQILYKVLGWAGQRLVTSVHWLASVGEGEGWWGWALIILALGALFWTSR